MNATEAQRRRIAQLMPSGQQVVFALETGITVVPAKL